MYTNLKTFFWDRIADNGPREASFWLLPAYLIYMTVSTNILTTGILNTKKYILKTQIDFFSGNIFDITVFGQVLDEWEILLTVHFLNVNYRAIVVVVVDIIAVIILVIIVLSSLLHLLFFFIRLFFIIVLVGGGEGGWGKGDRSLHLQYKLTIEWFV